MSIVIRAATQADEGAVTALWQECALTVPHNDPLKDFQFACGKPASDILIAVEGDEIVGSIMVGHDGHRGWLYYVAVAPTRQRQGVGRRLVGASEEWLHQRGVPKVHLMVRETNTAVIEFYARIGYEPMPRVNMQKWLKQP